jgi:putative thiamine transport system ATP-binding protein
VGLELDRISLRLHGLPLIASFSLGVAPGEVVTLMGASGSGKTSLLSYIAGDLESPFSGSGTVRLSDKVLDGLPPERRRIGRLFQDDLLFPHMTVRENLLFGMPRGSLAHRQSRMRAALEQIGLADFEHRPPLTLSGGQRARVALMRSLLAEPDAILLDEPFSGLDSDLRIAMRELVFARVAEAGIPGLLVTHDTADAPQGGRVLKIAPDGAVQDA